MAMANAGRNATALSVSRGIEDESPEIAASGYNT